MDNNITINEIKNKKKSYKKDYKKSKIKSNNTKKKKIIYNKNIVNDNNGKILKNIICNKEKSKNIVNQLKKYLSSTEESNDLFINNTRDVIKLNKQGKSGATILLNKDDKIIKLFVFSGKEFLVEMNNNLICLKTNNYLNELLINKILSNLTTFIKLTKKEDKLVKKYIFKSNLQGVVKNKTFFVSDKFMYDKNNIKFYELDDLLEFNIKSLNSIYKNNNIEIIKKYDDIFVYKIIKPFMDTLIILNNKLNFTHGDFKLKNIFVKNEKNVNQNVLDMKTHNLILDFIPLISDLDKCNLELNNIKIMSSYGKFSFIKNTLSSVNNKHALVAIRHKCKEIFKNKNCEKYGDKLYYLDYFTLFICIFIKYLIIFGKNEFKNILSLQPKLINLFQSICKVNDENMLKLLNLLEKDTKINNNYYIGISKLSSIINNFCSL
jgi:hypothetical protein